MDCKSSNKANKKLIQGKHNIDLLHDLKYYLRIRRHQMVISIYNNSPIIFVLSLSIDTLIHFYKFVFNNLINYLFLLSYILQHNSH